MTMLSSLGLGEAGIYALLGYAVVFVGLIALMAVVILMGKFFTRGEKKAAPKAAATPVAAAPKATATPAAPAVAPGTAGQLKLHDVNPKTAAMIMAIVADKMGKPLNELRFISIKEVK